MERRQPVLVLLFFCLLVGGCSSILKLQLTYRLPEERAAFRGPISVEVVDRRPAPWVFTDRASKGAGAFSKDIQLSLAQPRVEKGLLMGTYEVSELFRVAFLERLKAAGINTGGSSDYRLVVEIQEFVVDLLRSSFVEKRWHVKIQYQGTLFRGNSPLYSQNVRVDSEKLRYWKEMGLEALATDSFTDAINNFDLQEAISRLR